MGVFMKEGESYFSPHKLSELDFRQGKVLLEVKRAFTSAGCAVSVYGWAPPNHAPAFVKTTRTVLARIVLSRSTPKDEIRCAMDSLLILVLQRLGTNEYQLRAKMGV